jgi:hypothetical protein
MKLSAKPASSIKRAESASKAHGIKRKPGSASRLRRRLVREGCGDMSETFARACANCERRAGLVSLADDLR